jgi:hypothetical protein
VGDPVLCVGEDVAVPVHPAAFVERHSRLAGVAPQRAAAVQREVFDNPGEHRRGCTVTAVPGGRGHLPQLPGPRGCRLPWARHRRDEAGADHLAFVIECRKMDRVAEFVAG